jgi:type II secretion system protein J
MRINYDNSGFTLIEMLIATAVSSIILLMVYTAYSSIIKSVNQGNIASSYYEKINKVMQKLDSDLQNAYWNSTVRNINFISTIEGNSSRLNFITVENKNNRIILSVNNSLPYSDIHEVGYYLKKNNKTGKTDLVRRNEIYYDKSPLEGGTEDIILENVESIKFDFRSRSDWTDSWESRDKKRLPYGIKTTLVLYDPYKKKDIYELYTICNMSYE